MWIFEEKTKSREERLKEYGDRGIRTMILTNQGLNEIGKAADEKHNVTLMFLVQILKELREIKTILKEH